jgi:hypothetical protein
MAKEMAAGSLRRALPRVITGIKQMGKNFRIFAAALELLRCRAVWR